MAEKTRKPDRPADHGMSGRSSAKVSTKVYNWPASNPGPRPPPGPRNRCVPAGRRRAERTLTESHRRRLRAMQSTWPRCSEFSKGEQTPMAPPAYGSGMAAKPAPCLGRMGTQRAAARSRSTTTPEPAWLWLINASLSPVGSCPTTCTQSSGARV